MHQATMTINGRAIAGAGTFEVRNPSTGQVIGTAPNGSSADLEAAVAVAHAAFQSWSQKSDAELAEACIAVTNKINIHAEELAVLLTQEQGKPLNGLGSR